MIFFTMLNVKALWKPKFSLPIHWERTICIYYVNPVDNIKPPFTIIYIVLVYLWTCRQSDCVCLIHRHPSHSCCPSERKKKENVLKTSQPLPMHFTSCLESWKKVGESPCTYENMHVTFLFCWWNIMCATLRMHICHKKKYIFLDL